MDWKGLLTWSLKYQDGTVDKNLKPMSAEDMKFIEDAYESVCMNEMKEIMKILDKLKAPEEETDQAIQDRCDDIEDLQILFDGIENSRNIVRAKRFREIVEYFFNTKNMKIKQNLATLLGSMMQNDKFIQSAALDLGIFKLLDLLHKSEDDLMNSKYVYVLTGVLYGEYEKSKTLFLEEFDGMKVLYNLLIKTPNSTATFRRILNIIKELTKIEEKEAENYKVRYLAMSKISEIKLNFLLLNILNDLDYNSADCIDSIKVTLEILSNIVKVFDSLDQIYKTISDLNTKLNASTILNTDEIQVEKAFIIESLKSIKSEFVKKEQIDQTQESNNGLNLIASDENGIVKVETDENRGSMHIQLK